VKKGNCPNGGAQLLSVNDAAVKSALSTLQELGLKASRSSIRNLIEPVSDQPYSGGSSLKKTGVTTLAKQC
jgi:hypothetical protein